MNLISKLPVHILALREGEDDGKYLDLVLPNVDETSLEYRTVKTNRVYDTFIIV